MIPENYINDVISDIAGDDVVPLVKMIIGKSNVSEFKIADSLGITVNHVRNMFYRLQEHNLVEFTRKKDKKKGWYVYYWTLDVVKFRDLMITRKDKMIELMKIRLKKEKSGEFFKCPDSHIRSNLENAMEYGFRCPECDLPLERDENAKFIAETEKRIENLKKEIEELKVLKIKVPKERKLTRERVVKKKVKRKTKLMKETKELKRGKKKQKKNVVKTAKKKIRNIFKRKRR